MIASLLLLSLSCTDKDVSADDSQPTGDSVDTESGPWDGDPETVELRGRCPMESHRGAFVVDAYTDYSIADGRMQTGVVPTTVLTEESTIGDCRLLRRENPLCDPACDNSEACGLDGECVPYPEDIDLGLVSIEGLKAEVLMEGKSPGYHYFDTALPHPGYDPGVAIRLRTGDGAIPRQSLFGVGPEELVSLDEELVVRSGEDLIVSWSPPATTTRADVSLKLTIDQHGASPLQVKCVFDDTGQGVVDASMVSALVDGGVTGFPNATLSRETSDLVEIEADSCMDFRVRSPRTVDVDVDGFTPCSSNDDCPDGMECNLELEICE